jgi:hypothetical protein
MIQHGNLKAALELVMGYNDASTFPFPVANMLIDRMDTRDGLGLVRLRLPHGVKPTVIGLSAPMEGPAGSRGARNSGRSCSRSTRRAG